MDSETGNISIGIEKDKIALHAYDEKGESPAFLNNSEALKLAYRLLDLASQLQRPEMNAHNTTTPEKPDRFDETGVKLCSDCGKRGVAPDERTCWYCKMV